VARRLEKVAEVKKYILNAAGLANDVSDIIFLSLNLYFLGITSK
jgi:hypothetical protein